MTVAVDEAETVRWRTDVAAVDEGVEATLVISLRGLGLAGKVRPVGVDDVPDVLRMEFVDAAANLWLPPTDVATLRTAD